MGFYVLQTYFKDLKPFKNSGRHSSNHCIFEKSTRKNPLIKNKKPFQHGVGTHFALHGIENAMYI